MENDPHGMIGGELFSQRTPVRRETAHGALFEVDAHDSAKSTATNLSLEKAMRIVGEIDLLRGVQRELKAAFKDDELNGGWKAALDHPLWGWAEQRIAALHEDMKGLI